VYSQVAAHDALQAAAAALSLAVKSKGTAATIAAAKEVEAASLYIARLIGDPEAHRAALAQELAAENAALTPTRTRLLGEPPLHLDFTPATPTKVCLLAPVQGKPECSSGPLLVYVPGLDGSGQGIRRQLDTLTRAGYDVRALYIPAADRSTWQQLASTVVPLIDGLVATKAAAG
jgi:hypothetical protein